MTTPNREEILLDVQGLQKYFPITKGIFRRTVGHVKAVENVSFQVHKGETLGVVGESGCGKTTMGLCIMHLIQPTQGTIRLNTDDGWVEVNARSIRGLRDKMQIVFQDPFSSLNPRMRIRDIVAEPLQAHGMKSRRERYERVEALLQAVGLGSHHMNRFPHEFSGGQRQRIGIARALSLNPSLVVCDEPVSALDVSVQAQVLNLLADLQEEFGLTYLFIAHDLSVVQHISDRVAVMYLGRIVEMGDVDSLFSRPKHPYTEALLSAIPDPDPDVVGEQIILQGDVPSPANPPTGCHFHPRCRYAQERCRRENPELVDVDGQGHLAACHYAQELSLTGVYKGETA
ncbi:MAG: ABC transporter ATP-binding protein [Limnochordia bacterium]|jgi:oligopeptide/dipeptide ABC transporter ATP-binding protein|nr:dipeptide ABC transporter ATP-binding protein [Bacillota bacterium]